MAATTEAKATTEPKEIEEISEPPLKYKTWVLRVSVHCEGCRKKVTKILKNIDGVYKTEVDMRQQKVTVTGNVEAETLIRKLTKTGKHAELWPQPTPNNNAKDKKKNKGKGKEKAQPESESPEESSHGGAAVGGGENEKEAVKVEVVHVQGSAKKNGNEGGSTSTSKKVDGGNSVKASEGGGAPAKAGGGGGQVKEAKAEVARQVGNSQNQPPVVEKNGGGESDCEAEKSAGGGGGGASGTGGKKKKKKGQKGNAANVEVDEDDHCGDDAAAPPSTALPNRGNVPVGPNGPGYQHASQFPHGVYGPNGPRMPPYGPHGPSFVPAPANHGLPPQQVYENQHPMQFYRPPVQALSYNTAYPTHGASHYATPAPNFHSYTHAPPQMEPYPNQQYYPYHQPSYGAPPRSDSFELFSDENPNGCRIM